MAEERQASYVLARRSFCGATKENEGKEKKRKPSLGQSLPRTSRVGAPASWPRKFEARSSISFLFRNHI